MRDDGGKRRTIGRPLLVAGAAVLLVGLVAGFGVFSLREIERQALAAAEAEGRALLRAVSTGVERSLTASAAVERLLADRLLEFAADLDLELARSPGREDRVLRTFVVDHGLKGAVLLDDPTLRVRIAVDGNLPVPPAGPASPLASSRLTSLVAGDLAQQARRADLVGRGEIVLGFGEDPFQTGVEFLVGRRLPRTGAFLLLRQDAERLSSFRREEGVERFLADAAAADGIAYLHLQGDDGVILAASDPARVGERLPLPTGRPEWAEGPGGRVLDVGVPAVFGERSGTLRVGLAAGPVRGVIDRGRRSVIGFSALALALAAAGGAGLLAMARTRRRREEAFEREMRNREQAAAMGRLSAGVAHEVRSPLNAIGMAAQRLDREAAGETPDAERIRGIVAAARKEVARLNRIVEDFLELGRARPLDLARFDAGDLVREVIAAEDPGAAAEAPPEPVAVRADREELRKAVANLVRNARQAAGDAPVAVAWRASGDTLEIEVRDGGPGVPEEDRERVFEHFFTNRPGGTGLGLALARAAAAKHGGRLTVGEAPEGGAAFLLVVPRREDG